ncbi:hypothetical protein SAMN05216410_0632 [Sanguibacter gelidistatuariae]|uniref:Uncharacterized protein n=1 Tax=Sanguibacter gelidistatuariae TaxID=1814289 RepID=A0A1G6H125_9MICO|nr:hypothetical protein [Sanguibacter gelidistatuariae]SDB87854.1 hypothetical protein SAMN05216410_0632 [Sanguibacter gelidistatuariae]
MDNIIRSAATRSASIASAAVLATGLVLAAGTAASAQVPAPQVGTTQVVTTSGSVLVGTSSTKKPIGTNPGVAQPLNGSAWQD